MWVCTEAQVWTSPILCKRGWRVASLLKSINHRSQIKLNQISHTVLCEAQIGYAIDFIIYSGVPLLFWEIVFTLLQRYLNKGYHIFMHNFYNSIALTKELYNHGVHCSGTLQLKRGAPKVLQELANQKLLHGNFRFQEKETLSCFVGTMWGWSPWQLTARVLSVRISSTRGE